MDDEEERLKRRELLEVGRAVLKGCAAPVPGRKVELGMASDLGKSEERREERGGVERRSRSVLLSCEC